MTRKFWNWVRNEEPDSFGSDRTLYLDGEISDETWFGDEVTPNGCNSFRDGLVYLHNHKRQRASDHWTACRRRNIDY